MPASEPRPPILYKYLTCESARKVLQNQTLRWSVPGELNDPYDIQFDLQVVVDKQAVAKRVLRKMAGNSARFKQEQAEIVKALADLEQGLPPYLAEIRELMRNTKILCLTNQRDNILMWSHYAEYYRGVVLGFGDARGVDSPWKTAQPVSYVKHIPRLLDEKTLIGMMTYRLPARIDPQAALDHMLLTKGAVWSYEREWRISSGAGRNRAEKFELIPFHPQELKHIVLGSRTPPDDRESILQLARSYSEVKISQLVQSPRDFELSVTEL